MYLSIRKICLNVKPEIGRKNESYEQSIECKCTFSISDGIQSKWVANTLRLLPFGRMRALARSLARVQVCVCMVSPTRADQQKIIDVWNWLVYIRRLWVLYE